MSAVGAWLVLLAIVLVFASTCLAVDDRMKAAVVSILAGAATAVAGVSMTWAVSA